MQTYLENETTYQDYNSLQYNIDYKSFSDEPIFSDETPDISSGSIYNQAVCDFHDQIIPPMFNLAVFPSHFFRFFMKTQFTGHTLSVRKDYVI